MAWGAHCVMKATHNTMSALAQAAMLLVRSGHVYTCMLELTLL